MERIFRNSEVTSDKMVEKKKNIFWLFSLTFQMGWSVLLRVLASKTIEIKAWTWKSFILSEGGFNHLKIVE